MATINIGNLAFTHKGDYDGSTAYAKNDVVYYATNGNAYIAKQATTGNAPTNATYWNQFAQGSGGIWNSGLSLGSAGQVVKVNSGGTALEFGAAGSSGKILQYQNTFLSGQYSNSSASFGDFSGLPEFSITPTATSSKILIMSVWSLACENWNVLRFLTKTGSGSYGAFLEPTGASGSQLAGHFSGCYTYGDGNTSQSVSCSLLHSPNTTSQVSYKLQGCSHNPNTIYINRTTSFNSSYEETGVRTSNIMLMELAG